MTPVDQLGDDPAGCRAGIPDAEHLADFGQGETDRLRGPDEGEAIKGVVAVGPIAGRQPLRGREQPEVLVIANRGGGEAAPTGELSDAHERDDSPLDIEGYLKV